MTPGTHKSKCENLLIRVEALAVGEGQGGENILPHSQIGW